MGNNRKPVNLTTDEIKKSFDQSEWGKKFPPLLTVDQLAELLSVPKKTIYEWSSQGRFTGCCRRLGKHLRFFRDKVIKHLFYESKEP